MSAPLPLGPLAVRSGAFALPASKSLANRALLIGALSPAPLHIRRLSDAADTQTLQRLLTEVRDGATLDCGPAGTTFRFLTAYLALQPGRQTLTGSARMLERPIGQLVDALRQLGADIRYVGTEGYPPLAIGAATLERAAAVTLAGDVSSQYLSALMLIGPNLPDGLTIHWTGELVSRPYLAMTADLMRAHGASVRIEDPTITVEPKPYTGGTYEVESDWSAASYAAAWCALGDVGTEFECAGLRQNSLQGDRQLTEWIAEWGVATSFHESGLRFRKTADRTPATFECDFEGSPDLAQTFSALCACTGTTGLFTGLQTLRIKETDRVAALQAELQKASVFLSKLPPRFSPNSAKTYYMQEGAATWEGSLPLATYHDHRMAMALSLLAARGPIELEDPGVVGKSFPQFWDSLAEVTAAAA